MGTLSGIATKSDGTPAELVRVFAWPNGADVIQSIPDASGNWSATVTDETLQYGITYIANGFEPITHGPYSVTSTPVTTIPWTPDNITTSLWLDADDSTTITIETGVSEWRDKSGNLRHANQVTAGSQPNVLTNTLNGKSVVNFDGSDDFLTLPDLSTFTSASIFAVKKASADPAIDVQTSGSWYFGNATSYAHYTYTDGNIYENFGSTSRKTVGNPVKSVAEPNIYSVESQVNSWIARLNSSSIFETTTNTVGLPTAPCLGRHNNLSDARYFSGYYAEIILLDYVPVQVEREKIEGYLAHKWGIAGDLPVAHPYKTEAP